jgi:hypothetical protein
LVAQTFIETFKTNTKLVTGTVAQILTQTDDAYEARRTPRMNDSVASILRALLVCSYVDVPNSY